MGRLAPVLCLVLMACAALISGCGGSSTVREAVTLTSAQFGGSVNLHVGQTMELWEESDSAMDFDCVMSPANVLRFVVGSPSRTGDVCLTWTALQTGRTQVQIRRYGFSPFPWVPESNGSVTVFVSP